VIDDSGDRKDGTKTAHVGHQWLGRYGKTDNGVVTVTTLWADERLYYPVHARPYTPARHFGKGKNDPAFRTKLAIGADLAIESSAAGVRVPCGGRGQCVRGPGRVPWRTEQGRPAVCHGAQAPPGAPGPTARMRTPRWTRPGPCPGTGPRIPATGKPVARAFRDGHTETWWAADAALGWWGPDGTNRLVVTTADPGTLPGKATWYLATNLPRPGGPREAASAHPPADLAEVTRIYGIRHWIRAKLQAGQRRTGWADFQVRSDTAIRRHTDPGQLRILLLLGRLVRR